MYLIMISSVKEDIILIIRSNILPNN